MCILSRLTPSIKWRSSIVVESCTSPMMIQKVFLSQFGDSLFRHRISVCMMTIWAGQLPRIGSEPYILYCFCASKVVFDIVTLVLIRCRFQLCKAGSFKGQKVSAVDGHSVSCRSKFQVQWNNALPLPQPRVKHQWGSVSLLRWPKRGHSSQKVYSVSLQRKPWMRPRMPFSTSQCGTSTQRTTLEMPEERGLSAL